MFLARLLGFIRQLRAAPSFILVMCCRHRSGFPIVHWKLLVPALTIKAARFIVDRVFNSFSVWQAREKLFPVSVRVLKGVSPEWPLV